MTSVRQIEKKLERLTHDYPDDTEIIISETTVATGWEPEEGEEAPEPETTTTRW